MSCDGLNGIQGKHIESLAQDYLERPRESDAGPALRKFVEEELSRCGMPYMRQLAAGMQARHDKDATYPGMQFVTNEQTGSFGIEFKKARTHSQGWTEVFFPLRDKR